MLLDSTTDDKDGPCHHSNSAMQKILNIKILPKSWVQLHSPEKVNKHIPCCSPVFRGRVDMSLAVEKYTDGIACNNHDREHFTHTFIYNSWIEIMLPVTKALPKVKVR
jgi:hypothetical protein